MREAGIIGAPRPKMSEEEKQAKRKEYSKNYRSRIFAEAKAYEELQKQGTTKVSRRRKLAEE